LSEPDRPGVKLAQLVPGDAARIIDVIEDIPEMLRYLDTIGMRPGAAVDVVECAPLSGPLTITNERGRHAISIELARLITVVPEATAKLQTA
jgi:DtxR family Mn-dependent transcriptional regulator